LISVAVALIFDRLLAVAVVYDRPVWFDLCSQPAITQPFTACRLPFLSSRTRVFGSRQLGALWSHSLLCGCGESCVVVRAYTCYYVIKGFACFMPGALLLDEGTVVLGAPKLAGTEIP